MAYKSNKLTYIVKLAIICLIAASLLFIIFSSSENNINSNSSTNSSDADLTKDKVNIKETVFSVSGKNPYKIAAKEVTYGNNGMYFLDTISGSYIVGHNGEVEIQAGLGSFNSVLNIVELKKDVKISYLGYDIISEGINLDLQHRSANSPQEVHMIGAGGGIDAESFEVTPEFNQIIFHGNVKARFIINNIKY